jgi:hypothetical protein
LSILPPPLFCTYLLFQLCGKSDKKPLKYLWHRDVFVVVAAAAKWQLLDESL